MLRNVRTPPRQRPPPPEPAAAESDAFAVANAGREPALYYVPEAAGEMRSVFEAARATLAPPPPPAGAAAAAAKKLKCALKVTRAVAAASPSTKSDMQCAVSNVVFLTDSGGKVQSAMRLVCCFSPLRSSW
jgi:hypothetical protein